MPSSPHSYLSMTLIFSGVKEDMTLHATGSMKESSDRAWQYQTQCAGSLQLRQSKIGCAPQDQQLLWAGRAMCCSCNIGNNSLLALQT